MKGMSPDPAVSFARWELAFVRHPPLWGSLRRGLMSRVVELMSTTLM
jgi:hypothetical protein